MAPKVGAVSIVTAPHQILFFWRRLGFLPEILGLLDASVSRPLGPRRAQGWLGEWRVSPLQPLSQNPAGHWHLLHP